MTKFSKTKAKKLQKKSELANLYLKIFLNLDYNAIWDNIGIEPDIRGCRGRSHFKAKNGLQYRLIL